MLWNFHSDPFRKLLLRRCLCCIDERLPHINDSYEDVSRGDDVEHVIRFFIREESVLLPLHDLPVCEPQARAVPAAERS